MAGKLLIDWGDGTQSGGHGERIYLLNTLRAAIAKARGEG